MSKISIRFFNDKEVRAACDDGAEKWFFSILDVVGVLSGQGDYAKATKRTDFLFCRDEDVVK